MTIKKLLLKNFRNYAKKNLEFPAGTTLIIGKNAVGKTNLLEAIYLLASGKSFRVRGVESEMIRYGQEIAGVDGLVLDEGTELKIILTKGEVGGEKVAKKRYFINGIGRKATDFVGCFRAVYFGPQDLDLIAGSPGTRRRYLDFVLSQVNRDYSRAVLSYEKGVRARNKLLEIMQTGETDRRKLFFWDQLLIKNGNLITRKREEFLHFVNNGACGGVEGFEVQYDPSTISEQRLAQYEREEIAAGMTLVGPHRDDFVVRTVHESRDLATYGSRGEQRLAVLWLKLSELGFIREQVGDMPVLLLDDIFSELDEEHQHLVLKVINQQQTIITSANFDLANESRFSRVNVIILAAA